MNDEEFRRLLEAEIPRLRRVAARTAPPGADPEDLTQDALERAWRGRESFRGSATLSTWLYRIVLNRAADLATRTRPIPVDVAALDEADLFGFEVDDPGALLDRAADEAALRAALSKLNPVDRMVLVLHDGEGWGAKEIGEACGLASAAAHKRIQRGRFRLADALNEPTGGARPNDGHCLRYRSLAPDYLDGELPADQKAAVEAHLRECEFCPPLAQAVIGLRAALERGSEPTDIHAQIGRFLRLTDSG